LQTNLAISIATSLIGHWFGEKEVAGYGTAARLEFLLIPLVFGVGGTLVSMVGMNVGAGQGKRARHIALVGGLAGFVLAEVVGVAAAIWPEAWLRPFADDPEMLAAGSTYLRIVGPFYGFYGLGFALYFAGQGAGTVVWPLLGGLVRLIILALGGWIALKVTGEAVWLYATVALGMLIQGLMILLSTVRPQWGATSSAASNVGLASSQEG
jgi:Na+-driven multidrug efflux pump